MKKLRAQHYILLLVALASLAAASLAYYFMYKGAIGLAESADRARAAAVLAAAEGSTAEKSEDLYASTAADRARLPTLLVSEGDAVPFIDAVEAIGTSTGATVTLSSLSSGTDAASSHPIVAAQVSIEGTWGAAMAAVESVENLPYAISIQSLRLDRTAADAAASKAAPRWEVSLGVSALSSP